MPEQHGYVYNRVLIDVDVALDSPFDDGVLWFSGAQIGMLRTITRYLRRQHTFVETYEEGYYISPSTEDWDTISSIVADLEGTLMGNPNVIWGYEDRLLTREAHTMLAPGAWEQEHPIVPAGEIWIMQGLSVYTNQTGAFYDTYVDHGLNATQVVVRQTPIALSWDVATNVNFILKTGDFVLVQWNNTVVGQQLVTDVWGYKMKVPV
ncbi:MAG: hypothetical protein KAJ19_26245 [Gammaproteobacteria bacterium]|nr:hypothetical protein [Gammaproteobacteria bacterium]